MNDYLNLTGKPALLQRLPLCEACELEVDYGNGDWICPGCGTSWPGDKWEADPDEATLYEEWSGEAPCGIEVSVEEAWRYSGVPVEEQQSRRDRLRAALPTAFEAPGGEQDA